MPAPASLTPVLSEPSFVARKLEKGVVHVNVAGMPNNGLTTPHSNTVTVTSHEHNVSSRGGLPRGLPPGNGLPVTGEPCEAETAAAECRSTQGTYGFPGI